MQSVTLELPDTLYSQIVRRAEATHRSVEVELLEVLAQAVPASEELSPALAEAVEALETLDSSALRQIAQSTLAAEDAARMEELHLKRQSEGLTAAESAELTPLVELFERNMLVRAQAAKILYEREQATPARPA